MVSTAENRQQINPPGLRYLGGFLDDLLVFDIEAYPKPTLVTPDNVIYQPKIAVSSSDRSKLEFVQRQLPSEISSRINPDYSDPEDREHDRWKLNIGNAIGCHRFLQWIMSYLEFSRPQAVVFNEFLQQKREVIRVVDNLERVPRLYPTPEDRMDVESEFRNRLITTKGQISPVNTLPDPERLAGILDANATFVPYASRRQDHPDTVEFDAHAELISTQRAFLEVLYREYGGTEPTEYNEGRRHIGQSIQWQLNGYGVSRLLRYVEPHLVLRGTEARLIIEFLRVKRALAHAEYHYDPNTKAVDDSVLNGYIDRWRRAREQS